MRFLLLLVPGLWRDLRDAARFLTRLPIPGTPGGRDIQRAFGAFPLAGALIGVFLVALDWTLASLHLPPLGRDVLLVAALALLTGGTHLEGLMTVGDHLLAPRVPEAPRFAYPRDDASNQFGVVAVLCVLLLKVAALSALQGTARLEALIAAPLLGRWVLVLVASLFPPPDLEAVGIRSAAPLALLTAAGVTWSARARSDPPASPRSRSARSPPGERPLRCSLASPRRPAPCTMRWSSWLRWRRC